MKTHRLTLYSLACLLIFTGFTILTDTTKNNRAENQPVQSPKFKGFALGERFSYLIHYGFVNAGTAVVEISDQLYQVDGRRCYKANVFGRSTGMFKMMMPLNDNWGAYMDVNSLLPMQSYRYLEEGRYRRYEIVDFMHEQEKAIVQLYHSVECDSLKKSKDFEVPSQAHSLVSGAFFMRTLDYEHYQEGDTIHLPGFLDEENFDLDILFEGRETVKTKAGKYEAVRLTPVMPDNKLFDGENSVSFWFSDDPDRILLKIQARMFVGAVEIELTDVQKGKEIVGFQPD